MKFFKHILFLIGWILLSELGFPQNQINPLKAENESEGIAELPPLQELIESAYKHSPLIVFQNLAVDKQELLVEIEKKLWLNGFKLNSNYNWGTNNANIEGSLVPQSYSSTAQLWYGVGGSISFQLSTMLNRKENIRVRELESEIAKQKTDELKQNLKKIIIELYLNVKMKAEVLDLRNDAVVTSEITYNYAVKELENNAIEILDYSKVHTETVKAKIFLKEARRDYVLSLTLLEEISGLLFR